MRDENTLVDRMVAVLQAVNDINSLGARAIAYVRAGINMRDFSYVEISTADEQAVSIELARRISGSPTRHDSRCA